MVALEGWDLSGYPDQAPAVDWHPESLAYCITTSGSTGKPKAVGNSHKGLLNRLQWMQAEYGIGPGDRVLQKTPYGFDVSVWEFFWPLMTGACLVVAEPGAHRDPEALGRVIRDEGITTLHFVPSMLGAFAASGELPACTSLRRILCSGEALPRELQDEVLGQTTAGLHNLYGPTEAAIDVTVWACRPEPGQTQRADRACHRQHPDPRAGRRSEPGAGGCVGRAVHRRGEPGAGLSRPSGPDGGPLRAGPAGPIGQPDVPLGRPGAASRGRGDRVSRPPGPSGEAAGPRIELGEIEAGLRSYPGVRDAVVVLRDGRLVGYVAGEAQPDEAGLKQHLAALCRSTWCRRGCCGWSSCRSRPTASSTARRCRIRSGRATTETLAERRRARRSRRSRRSGRRFWACAGRPGRQLLRSGGDSILSLQVIARARRQGLVLTLRDTFQHQTVRALAAAARRGTAPAAGPASTVATERAERLTPSDLPLAGLSQAQIDALPVPAAEIADAYPLSPLQQGLLFHALHAPEAGLYVNQVLATFDGPLDAGRFARAWEAAIERHDILRTGFLWDGPAPLQLVRRSVPVPVEIRDGRGLDEPGIAEIARWERERGFDLSAPPLMRVLLLRMAENRHRLVWTFHHILMDGWSTARLIGEVLSQYHGAAPAFGPGRYRDHIAWLAGRDAAADEAFWRGQLARLETPTRLADALPAPVQKGDGHGVLATRRDADRTARLAAFCRRQRITLNTLVQGAWTLLLSRYTGQPSVAFGATVAGRPVELPGAETLLGLFINTLPVIQQPDPEARVGDWLRQVQDVMLVLHEHEHTPLADIQRWGGQGGLFDTLLVFENYPIDHAARAGGDLRVVGGGDGGGDALPAVAGGPGRRHARHRLWLSPRRLRAGAGRGAGPPSRHAARPPGRGRGRRARLPVPAGGGGSRAARGVADRAVRGRAVSSGAGLDRALGGGEPGRTAVIFGDREVSRGELDRRANHLAHRLVQAGVGPDVLVGVVLERSVELLVALLAVLKAGGAYVPLAPDAPAARLAEVAADSGLRLVLTQASLAGRLPQGLERILVEAGEAEAGPAVALHPDNLAYVIYTSGSTGKPKGVAVAHGPLAMHCRVTAPLYDMDENVARVPFHRLQLRRRA